MRKNNNARLEKHFVEEEEKRLEEIVKKMKLSGKSDIQICGFLSRRAGYYLKLIDKYSSDRRYNQCKEEGE
mgnify:CR=1 FL=1